MTVDAWLRERSPEPPARLTNRIHEVLGSRAAADAARTADVCVDAAALLLDDLLARPTAGRESALDLLAADALVTYAFEAAANDPSTLTEKAELAMRRLSHVPR
jgi:hypothetical protein